MVLFRRILPFFLFERRDSLHNNILCKCFESYSIELHNGNRYMTGLAGIDVPDCALLSFVGTADYFAFHAVFQSVLAIRGRLWFRFFCHD
jgi:hypothetical protein